MRRSLHPPTHPDAVLSAAPRHAHGAAPHATASHRAEAPPRDHPPKIDGVWHPRRAAIEASHRSAAASPNAQPSHAAMHATQKAGRKIGLASNGSPAEVRMAQLVDETSRRTGLSPDKVAKIIAKRAAASGAASWDDLELVMIQAFSMLSGCDGGLDLDDPNYLAELADFWFREFLEDQELRKAAMSQHVVERPRLATTRSAQLASPGVEWERVLRQTAGLVRRRTLALQAQRTAEAVLARERFAMLRL